MKKKASIKTTENYLIDSKHPLGKGAFAIVYAAVNKKNPDKLLAMKRIKLSMLRQRPDLKILLEQEISVMKLLNCNHSVKFYESGEDKDYYNIIIEYCNGKTLNMDKKYSIEELKTLLIQLNTVFKLMNELHIIHRDLKLDNIFLNYPDPSDKSKFEVKLGDFGLSKQLVNTQESKTLAGSPVYMAPEILITKLRKPYTSKVDIWSLGVIIYQLLFQQFPFYGNSLVSLQKDLMKKNGIPQKIEEIEDENLKDLMKKIFVIEPKNRISWSNYFDHPFFKENNEEDYPNKIEFDLGENLKDNKYFNCFVYTDKNTGKKFFVKQYLKNFCEKAKSFKQAFYNANSLKNNKHSLKFKSIKSKKDYCYIEYEFIEGEILTEYLKKNVFDEQELRKKIQDFYYKLINEIEIKNISFSVLTTDSILIDKNKNFILFDFGFLKEILPRDKIAEYYIVSPNEIYSYNNSNVLNFGVILFKCICGNIPISIVEKRIDIPNDKKISNELLNFLSHCINRRNNIRYRWNNFKDDPWINPNRIEHVLNNNNLKIIVNYYEEKFKAITTYYNNYLASYFSVDCIVENFLFVLLNYIEFKMILGIFDDEKNDFSEQEEILFIESNINDTNEYNFASLNLNKYKIWEIFETKEEEKNNERKAILKTFKSNLKKYEINLKHILEYYLKIKEIRDEDFLKMLKKNPFNFINLYLKMFNEINWDYFSNFFDEPKMKKIFYEFLISVKIYLSRDNLKNFNNLKEILNILSVNDNFLKISVLDSQNKINFFSCLGGLFRFFQNYSEKHKINISSKFDNYNNYENYLINYLKLAEYTK